MATDETLSRELSSLHQEATASRQERRSPPANPSAGGGETSTQFAPPGQPSPGQQTNGEFVDFVNMIKELAEDTEKKMSTHPMTNVMGALVIGILIGRLFSRR